MNKFNEILKSWYLCLKYPFLYPRNRFTGRNRKNVLGHLLWKLNNQSIQNISITGKLVNNDTKKMFYSRYADFLNFRVRLDKDIKSLTFGNDIEVKKHSLNSLLWKDDRFTILGLELVFAMSGNPIVQVVVETKDKTDKTNYGFHYEREELVTNKFKYFWYKVLKWIDEEVLDRILFIPTYTELDAMPEGWRKAFGIQMCKEIKAALKKNHYLYKYRIMQIKEKFGTLRWYDDGAPQEVYDIIDKYEDLSWNTCVICGKPATKISGGWICPYCDDCFPKDHRVYQEKIDGEWKNTEEYKKTLEEADKQIQNKNAENEKEV